MRPEMAIYTIEFGQSRKNSTDVAFKVIMLLLTAARDDDVGQLLQIDDSAEFDFGPDDRVRCFALAMEGTQSAEHLVHSSAFSGLEPRDIEAQIRPDSLEFGVEDVRVRGQFACDEGFRQGMHRDSQCHGRSAQRAGVDLSVEEPVQRTGGDRPQRRGAQPDRLLR